jgi:hypothetical protein
MQMLRPHVSGGMSNMHRLNAMWILIALAVSTVKGIAEDRLQAPDSSITIAGLGGNVVPKFQKRFLGYERRTRSWGPFPGLRVQSGGCQNGANQVGNPWGIEDRCYRFCRRPDEHCSRIGRGVHERWSLCRLSRLDRPERRYPACHPHLSLRGFASNFFKRRFTLGGRGSSDPRSNGGSYVRCD